MYAQSCESRPYWVPWVLTRILTPNKIGVCLLVLLSFVLFSRLHYEHYYYIFFFSFLTGLKPTLNYSRSVERSPNLPAASRVLNQSHLHVLLIPAMWMKIIDISWKPAGRVARPLVKDDKHLDEIICPPRGTELNRIGNLTPITGLLQYEQ